VCDGFAAVEDPPSPKSQAYPEISPLERLVNETTTGESPEEGVSEKSATGAGGGGGSVTVTHALQIAVSEPPGPVAVKVTV